METLKDKIIAKQDELIKALDVQIKLVTGDVCIEDMEKFGYLACDISQKICKIESELSRLKDEGEDFTKPVLSVDKITDIKTSEQSDKLTAEDLIKTIVLDKANLEYIAKTGVINGTLYIEIKRVIKEYASQFVGEKVTDETQYEKSLRLIDEYFAETPKEEIQKLIDKYDSRPKWRRILDKLI